MSPFRQRKLTVISERGRKKYTTNKSNQKYTLKSLEYWLWSYLWSYLYQDKLFLGSKSDIWKKHKPIPNVVPSVGPPCSACSCPGREGLFTRNWCLFSSIVNTSSSLGTYLGTDLSLWSVQKFLFKKFFVSQSSMILAVNSHVSSRVCWLVEF